MSEAITGRFVRDGVQYDARIVVGHSVTNDFVVVGLDGSDASLIWLPLAEAAAFSSGLAKLVRSLQRKERRKHGGAR